MNKKKVKEYIKKAIDCIITEKDPVNAIDALIEADRELSKSDWISVEDELPEYDKEVFVTSKMSPDTIFKDRRVECTAFPKDSNDFIILWEGRMARITHWKPIEKLEE